MAGAIVVDRGVAGVASGDTHIKFQPAQRLVSHIEFGAITPTAGTGEVYAGIGVISRLRLKSHAEHTQGSDEIAPELVADADFFAARAGQQRQIRLPRGLRLRDAPQINAVVAVSRTEVEFGGCRRSENQTPLGLQERPSGRTRIGARIASGGIVFANTQHGAQPRAPMGGSQRPACPPPPPFNVAGSTRYCLNRIPR